MKHYASRLGLVDIANDRSAHVLDTPRGAGIGFFLAIVLVLLFFHFDIVLNNMYIFLSILVVFLFGVLDDYHDSSPNIKFIVLILATLLLSLDNIIIDDVGIFFGTAITLGWFAIPFTIFAVVGFTNALNLIDGLDGLAATISIVILATFFYVGYLHNDTFMMILSMAFIAALLAFLVFNWHPASIFMGDSGSLTLGFVISVLAVKSLVYLPTVSILFIAAVPLFDTLIVMIRRKWNGRSAFLADHCHFHHILRQFFDENTKKTVIFLSILQLVYSFIGLQLDKSIDEGYLIVLFILNIILIYIFLSAMIKRQKRKC